MSFLQNFDRFENEWWYKELEKALASTNTAEDTAPTLQLPVPADGGRRPSAVRFDAEGDDLAMEEAAADAPQDLPSIMGLDGITTWNLKYAILTAGIAIEYKYLRPFLTESFHRLSTHPEMTDQEAIAMVKEVLDSTKRMFSVAKVVPVLKIQKEARDFQTVNKKAREIKGYGMEFDATIRAMCGDTAVKTAVQHIWKSRTDAIGEDSAKKVFSEIIRWLIAAQRMDGKSYEAVWDEIRELLNRLKFEDP